jgi:hypothetical protein
VYLLIRPHLPHIIYHNSYVTQTVVPNINSPLFPDTKTNKHNNKHKKKHIKGFPIFGRMSLHITLCGCSAFVWKRTTNILSASSNSVVCNLLASYSYSRS